MLAWVVVAVIGAELGVLALLALPPRRAPLARAMLPGVAAGAALALALVDPPRLPLWLAAAGAAHGFDWWLRLRAQRKRAG